MQSSRAKKSPPIIRKAVFPVAGLGTRFLPATKAIPKEMLPVVDRPLLQYALEEAQAAGIEEFLFVTGRGKRAIEDHFDIDPELNTILETNQKEDLLTLVRQSEIPSGCLFYTRQHQPLGLGHAIGCAREFVADEPFAVILPDDFIIAHPSCLAQMIEGYQKVGGNLVAITEVPRAETSKYGILEIEKEENPFVVVKNLVEKPSPDHAPSCLSIIGRYILQPQIFTYLMNDQIGHDGEIQLTDSMVKLIGQQPFHGYRFIGRRYDCGSKIGYLEASLAYALHQPEMAAHVRSLLKKLI